MTTHPTKRAIIFDSPVASITKQAMLAACTYIDKYKGRDKGQCTQNKPWEQVHDAAHKLFGLHYGPHLYLEKGSENSFNKPDSNMMGMTPSFVYSAFKHAMMDKFGEGFVGKLLEQRMRRTPNTYVHVICEQMNTLADYEPLLSYIGTNAILFINIPVTGTQWSHASELLTDADRDATIQEIPYPSTDDPLQRELFRVFVQGAVKRFLGLKDGTE